MEPAIFLFLVGFAVSIGGWMVHEIMLAAAFRRSAKKQRIERIAGGIDAVIPSGTRASVLVCVRNGEQHIGGLLKAIEKQNLLTAELDLAKKENTIDSFIEAYNFISKESRNQAATWCDEGPACLLIITTDDCNNSSTLLLLGDEP